jgi:hypothetical protein
MSFSDNVRWSPTARNAVEVFVRHCSPNPARRLLDVAIVTGSPDIDVPPHTDAAAVDVMGNLESSVTDVNALGVVPDSWK